MRTLLVVVLVSALTPCIALAETAVLACVPGEINPVSMNIPANVTSFVLLDGVYPSSEPPDIRLFRRMGGGDFEQGLDISEAPRDHGRERWNLTPTEPLVEGGEYIFIDATCPDERTTRYHVDPAIALPTTLGVTTVTELRASRDRPGLSLYYYVRVGLALTAEAAAARSIYEGQRIVDGTGNNPWRPLDDFEDRVAVNCSGTTVGLVVQPGLRVFSHHAQLYGLGPSVFGESVEVDLVCEDAVRVDPDDEHVLTPSEIEEMDRIPDGGSAMDGGGLADGGLMDGGPVLGGGGCACRSTGGGPAPGGFGLLLFALAMFLSGGGRRRSGRDRGRAPPLWRREWRRPRRRT